MNWLGRERVHLAEVDSTSDEVWRRVERGAPHGLVVRADRQAAGRGRQGRGWTGAEGNLMVSWLMRLDTVPAHASALSIVEGIALARVLDRHAPGRIRLKWPNDLLLDGLKVGGLLLESRTGEGLVVVSGLGLNLRTPSIGWGELAGRAIALDEVVDLGADALLDALLEGVEFAVDSLLARGPEAMLGEWARWSALDGREIRWEAGQETGSGRVLGLAPDGGLRVALACGAETVLYSGDVHLRESS
jgi:BirA family biotin operon repressor/biotin-[acetyl-CoA-carboxylase] ligase